MRQVENKEILFHILCTDTDAKKTKSCRRVHKYVFLMHSVCVCVCTFLLVLPRVDFFENKKRRNTKGEHAQICMYVCMYVWGKNVVAVSVIKLYVCMYVWDENIVSVSLMKCGEQKSKQSYVCMHACMHLKMHV
jgi:hypothetical protein